jgi:quercetin dioxygenase-like cupin family protein
MAITLSARDVSVVTQVYEPGQESGWHSHAGIHAVAVISGVLTVYDSECRPQTFEPGRPYVGGQQPHLVRNETGAPVVMTVTYLNPSAPTTSTRHQPPPDGCPVG